MNDPDRAHGVYDPRRRRLLGVSAAAGALVVAPVLRAASAPRSAALSGDFYVRWETWVDALVPGAAAAGAAAYLAAQLAVPAEARTLFLRYMDWPGEHRAFYAAGLDGVDACARAATGRAFGELDEAARGRLVDAIAGGRAEGWQGPPAALFHFVCKADGADLAYGLHAGFERLDLPYRAHVEPPSDWPVPGGRLSG